MTDDELVGDVGMFVTYFSLSAAIGYLIMTLDSPLLKALFLVVLVPNLLAAGFHIDRLARTTSSGGSA